MYSQKNEISTNTKISDYLTVKQKKPKQNIKSIESMLSTQTKKAIKKIKKCNKRTLHLKDYSLKTYNELIRYLDSSSNIGYENGIYIANISLVKKRIKSVEKVNKILYKRVKKLYRGKTIRTLEAYELYIEDKIIYDISCPDMYKTMRKGTCISYATMLKAMCDISNIPCKIYAGWASPYDGHCWNRVKIKGKWYWVDLCWDDNTFCGDDSYMHSKRLWYDHEDYKPLTIYIVNLPY